MPLPPLTPEQRAAALDRAVRGPEVFAEIRTGLKRGTMSLPDVLARAATDDLIGRMQVSALLACLPGVGQAGAANIMEQLGIAQSRRVGSLGQLQREALMGELPQVPRSLAPPPGSPPPTVPPASVTTDPEMISSHDYVVALDNHQFFLSSCLCAEEDYPLDNQPVLAMYEPGLVHRAIEGDGIAQIPVEYTFSGTLLVLSPQQTNYEMPLRVEVWDGPAPDDTVDWPEAVEAHLEVDPHGLYFSSTTEGAPRLDVPPGGYHALITGRGFVAYGSIGQPPDDSWRIRLWPSPGPQAARRISAWHGERELRAEERQYLEGLLPQAYRLLGLDREPVPAPRAVVRAIDEMVGRLRADRTGGERAAELAGALGSLLGQQWCREFGWDWRLVSLRSFEGYGVLPPDSRFVYFAIKDVYDLLISETEEINLLLLFNMAAAGNLPPASGYEHVTLG